MAHSGLKEALFVQEWPDYDRMRKLDEFSLQFCSQAKDQPKIIFFISSQGRKQSGFSAALQYSDSLRNCAPCIIAQLLLDPRLHIKKESTVFPL